MTLSLIDKQDTSEILRDEIAAILALESANQVALATTAGKPDPDDWKLRVYLERSNPWETFQENVPADQSPIVNVWYDSSSFPEATGDIMSRQKADGVFNIDCYGFGVTSDNLAGGHNPGDREAAYAVHRAVRLVRNILMAAEYTYLGQRGTVWKRWPRSINIFQPQIESQAAQHIVGARIALEVQFNELSPQVEGDVLEYVSNSVTVLADGQVVVEVDRDYT